MKIHLAKRIDNMQWIIFCGHKITKANNHTNLNNLMELKDFKNLPEGERCNYCNRIAKQTKLIEE